MRCMLAASAMLASSAAHAAPVLPTGGSVASGSAVIGTPSSGNVTITQSSDRAIVNWNSFSVGQGGSVNFNNGSGATLNRVTGSASSAINGQLNATGSVYLVNPNGVVVGKTGVVNVGKNFVASTLGTSDAQFNAGGSLTLSGNSQATVVNYGKIGSLGGDVALVARGVSNNGTISAPNGSAGLLAGSQVTLRDSTLDDGKFSVDVGSSGDSATNTGTIQAADAELKANGGNVYALAGNTTGVIAATGTSANGGKVFLTAGDGNVTASGGITAQNADGSGGQVTARGTNISVGGSIDASATGSGKRGGNVSVVGIGNTSVLGTIDARGNNATGGTVETSGHTLSIGSASIDAGAGGEWLLDPYDLTVDATAASTIDATLNAGTSVTLQTTASGASGPGNQNAFGNGDIFVNSALSWSSAATLTLNAYRNVTVNAPITVTGAGSVVLDGFLNIPLSSAGFGANISFTGTPNSGQSLTINGTAFTLLYSMSDVQNINNNLGGDFALAKSLDATGVGSWAPLGTNGAGSVLNAGNGFGGVFEGLGNTISNLTINLAGTNWIGLFGNSTGAIGDIGMIGGSVSGGSSVGALAGFNAGWIGNTYATGPVTATGSLLGGLVGENEGTISNSHATGAVTDVGTNVSQIGGLVGTSYQATIASSYATGAVSVTSNKSGEIGGLVGNTFSGSITDSYATGSVTGVGGNSGFNPGSVAVGGLVGEHEGAVIDRSWESGAVTSGAYSFAVGGLVGDSQGYIYNAYALGAVSAGGNSDEVGGFVGADSYPISDVFSAGTVSAGGGSLNVGVFGGTIVNSGPTNAYWDTTTSGITTGNYATGLTTAQLSAALPAGFDPGQWSNANNQTTPFLPSAPGPFWIGSDSTHLFQPVSTASQLQAINNNLNGNYALIGNIDASLTSSWNSGFGLVPLGTDGAGGALNGGSGFNGIFDGLGYTIDNLSVTLPNFNTIYHDVGLFGISSGTVRNVGLVNATVSGQQTVGALVGANFGTVTDSFATGSVTGSFSGLNFGGLVGLNEGSISEAYADVAVTVGGAFDVGGLVGQNIGGTISDVYSIGNVNGGVSSSAVGGLIGAGAVSDGFWDWHVSGQSQSSGGTRLTTAQLQGTLPGSFSASIWGTSLGLYPYLKEFYPNGVQAIEGTAFSDAGVNPLAGARIGLDTGGSFIGAAPSGANGLYYIALPAGTLASNAAIMTYVSGAHSADLTFAVAIGTTPNVNLNATAIIGTTSALTLSSALSIASNDAAGLAAANGATSIGLTATGSSFTFDVARNDLSSLSLQTTGATAPLVISAPVSSSNGFNLNTQGALDIDAALTVSGLSSTVLRTGLDTTTVPGASLAELSFGSGGSLSFAPASHGSQLSINGTGYTLLYSASDIENINTDAALSGDYALATSLDATGVSGWVPVGLDASGHAQNGTLGFSGTFEGLGNTISHLSVPASPLGNAAMFGYTTGTIRDVRLASVTINATGTAGGLVTSTAGQLVNDSVLSGTISGGSYVGGLVGRANPGSVMVNDSAAVSIVATGDRVGGLAGWSAGTIVAGSANASMSGVNQVGGLVGWNDGSIDGSAVTVSSVTGSGYGVGGLVGYNTANASLTNSVATGSGPAIVGGSGYGVGGAIGVNQGNLVSGDEVAGLNVGTATTNTVGGFVGKNDVAGTIASSTVDATSVSGASFVGGFAGKNLGNVNASSSAATVSGASYVGGFAGSSQAGAALDHDTASGATSGTGQRVGGLVGWNAGSITNAKASNHTTGFDQTGGLVGWNDGAISDSSATGEVTGADYGSGGLVGYATSTSVLNDVYATGKVDGAGNGDGGLIGVNLGSVTNAYATGSVGTATTFTSGGLIGKNGGAVADVYAAGPVTGLAHASVGALFGVNTATGTLTNAYYDTLVTGTLQGIGLNQNNAAHVQALNAPIVQASFGGFDFVNHWTISPGDMPTLQRAP